MTVPVPVDQRLAKSVNNSAAKVRLHDQQVSSLQSKTTLHDTTLAAHGTSIASHTTELASHAATLASHTTDIATIKAKPGYDNPDISVMPRVSTNSTTAAQVMANLNLLMNRLVDAGLMH